METTPRRIAGEMKISSPILQTVKQEVINIPRFRKKIEEYLSRSASEISELILAGAIGLDSSDIHIEPQKENVKMRIRIDGVLHDVLEFDLKSYQTLLSRVKLLAGLKLNIFDRPQDGRFSVLSEKEPIEIRASSLPAEYGESLVLRILNPENLISIEELGIRKDLLAVFTREINRPNGMIIITGPTGSGKTTTLYAVMKKIQKPELKIITLEDPIEYHLSGISQTQVNPAKGYDFANGLKAIMRQDPEVILVGEIRDLETASMGIQAALTGHLVLTTLHTNDAAGTLARLQALGEKPVNIAPALNMVVAQRLVRKVCQKCVKMTLASAEEREKIKKALKGVPKEIISFSSEIKIARAKGCETCNFTGFRGRIGIFELFLVDEEMERFVFKGSSISELNEKAVAEGMITVYSDGIIKTVQGITTIEEVERVAGSQS